MDDPNPICPLCGREIPPDVPQSKHHLVPKARGGRHGETVLLHHICHKAIHAQLSETEIARDYATPKALRARPEIGKFLAWVAKRPSEFMSRMPGPRRKRR